jgi:hypothetical protein
MPIRGAKVRRFFQTAISSHPYLTTRDAFLASKQAELSLFNICSHIFMPFKPKKQRKEEIKNGVAYPYMQHHFYAYIQHY